VPITIPPHPSRRFDRPVSVRLQRRLWEQIESVAAANGVSPAHAMRHLLERCLSAESEA